VYDTRYCSNQGTKDTLKASSGQVVLSVQDLWLEYKARRGVVKAVRGASFQVRRGEALAVIGESGSGKTTLGLGLVRLLPRTARTVQGQVRYMRAGHEVDVLALPPNELRQFRWKECAMVFQSALNALNPVLRVSDQFADTARAHGGSFWAVRRTSARKNCSDWSSLTRIAFCALIRTSFPAGCASAC